MNANALPPICLVTGSSGFIGAHLVRQLLSSGVEVLALDIEPPNITHPRLRYMACDVSNELEFHAILDSSHPRWIVHLAAIHDLADPSNERRGMVSYRVNIDSVRHLLSWLSRHPEQQRLVLTSSQLVNRIGRISLDPNDCQPDTHYGRSKLLAEQLVRNVHNPGFIWTIVRPTTIWGPGMSAHYRRFLTYIRKGRYIHPGRLPLWKSYGYIGNTVYQYQQILKSSPESVRGRTLYMADYSPLSLWEYASRLAFYLKAPPIRSAPPPLLRLGAFLGTMLTYCGWRTFPLTLRRLHNILTEYKVDTIELEKIVGPLPYSFEDGVKATAHWCLNLPDPAAGRTARLRIMP